MAVECSICGNINILMEGRSFVCPHCGDAIRRLVWIAEKKPVRKQQTVPNENTVSAGNTQLALHAFWTNFWATFRSAVCSFVRLPENEGGKSTSPDAPHGFISDIQKQL